MVKDARQACVTPEPAGGSNAACVQLKSVAALFLVSVSGKTSVSSTPLINNVSLQKGRQSESPGRF